MPLELKVSCDSCHKGPDVLPVPFFSLYVRVRQVGPGKTSRVDRLHVVGIFCEGCLGSGKAVLPADLALVSKAEMPQARGTPVSRVRDTAL